MRAEHLEYGSGRWIDGPDVERRELGDLSELDLALAVDGDVHQMLFLINRQDCSGRRGRSNSPG